MTTPGTGRTRARQLALPVTVAAVGLATLGVVQALPNRHAMQSQLTEQSTRALSAAGITDARVQFDGRDASVHVGSAGDRERALAIVRSQQGVRVVHVIVDRGASSSGRTASGRRSKHSASPPPSTSPASPVPSSPAPSNQAPSSPAPSSRVPSSHGPSSHGPSSHGPSSHGPSGHGPSSHGPSGPAPSNQGPSGPAPNGARSGTTGPASPPGASDAVARVQDAVDACGPIHFATASAALTPAGRKAVEKVAAILRADTSMIVEIRGFTDAVGPAATNLALSGARAGTVYDTLRVLGITAARMSPVGYGESHPRFPNDSRAHRAANRRVAFTVSANPVR